jgi:hypothetical protein
MAYMGTNDPDGWVICNGTARTNGSDGRYSNLIAMGIGSGTTSNYTPPDYRGAFMRGTGTSEVSGYTDKAGPGLNAAQGDTFKKHTHRVLQKVVYAYTGGATTFFVTTNGSGALDANGATDEVGGTETRPFNFGVNWILKL